MTSGRRADGRIPVLYLAPWVDFGGTDTATIDWFRWIDRSRFAVSLITTQPSANRRLAEIVPFAEEVWALPDLMPGQGFPDFILDFVKDRGIEVVHIMNSRLGFTLIPDLKCLAPSPAVVVQLHVEEPDRSGYVRHVTTHYGNLVDGFSVSTEYVAKAIEDFGIPASKCHVIHTGIDAAGTFAPGLAAMRQPFSKGAYDVLYCGRLSEQKDPLLMVRVGASLRDRGRDFRIHVLGDGPLEERVRDAVIRARLDEHILFHGTDADLAPWYACSDLMLMTSIFEGIPLVVYDAMAMAVPLVAPALPGILEVLGETGGILVAPGADHDAYVDAVERLMDHPALARDLGSRARRRVLDQFSVERMAAEHAHLYNQVRPMTPNLPEASPLAPLPVPVRMRTRPHRDQPLVSVVIPCYDNGDFLLECIDSVLAQTYPIVEIIVVDDASVDAATRSVLDAITDRGDITVIRLGENAGPSAARQRGIDAANGRYILPVDADNRLTPEAVTGLVLQIQESGEQVGFVYPNQVFFGMRNEVAMAPAYNVDLLLENNFCDTSCLIDRDIFDAGVRYGEELRWAHEDWDFALSLAERDIRGVPASGRFLEVRKSGFTRSDLVSRSGRSDASIISRHPMLYGRRASVKSRWSPALSIIAADPIDDRDEARQRLREGLHSQTCLDAEVILRDDTWWWQDAQGPNVRRVAAAHDESPGAAVATGLGVARGRSVMVVRGSIDELFADSTVVEKTLQLLDEGVAWESIGFACVGADVPAFAPLGRERIASDIAVALAWPVRLLGDRGLTIDASDPLTAIAATFAEFSAAPTTWRQLPLRRAARFISGAVTMPRSEAAPGHFADSRRKRLSEAAAKEWDARMNRTPQLRRPQHGGEPWRPPLTQVLYRHIDHSGTSYTFSMQRSPPPSHALDYTLGCLHDYRYPGAQELVVSVGPNYQLVPAGEERQSGEYLLGHVEGIPFALLDPLFIARHRVTGQQVLVCGDDDPLLPAVDLITHLGFIEPHPLRPRSGPRGSHLAEALRQLAATRLVPPQAPVPELGPSAGTDPEPDRRVARWVVRRLTRYPHAYAVARSAYRAVTPHGRGDQPS